MTLFIACILLYHVGAGPLWYVAAVVIWIVHLLALGERK